MVRFPGEEMVWTPPPAREAARGADGVGGASHSDGIEVPNWEVRIQPKRMEAPE